MLRTGVILVFSLFLPVARAMGHGVESGEPHVHEAFPLVELFSGAALIFSVGSLWLSWRTRRMLLRSLQDSDQGGPLGNH